MVIHNMEEECRRLEHFKQETILHYLEYIDLDYNMDLYDIMLRAVVYGDFIDSFFEDYFKELDDKEKNKLIKLFQENVSLCFARGDINYWSDSIEGITLQDMDLIVLKLFNHFDYLMDLIKDGGDNTIDLLKKIQKSSLFNNSSVIDILRNNFLDGDALKKCLLELSLENSSYNNLSEEQIGVLFTYPNNILYRREDDNIIITDSLDLEKRIAYYLGDQELVKNGDLASLINIIGDELFEDTISNMYLDSLNKEMYK